jgi:hypothetical protein
MKIFSITCINNEAGIIETFVRVNSKFIDTFIFIDDSVDGTSQILNLLKDEGFNIISLYRNKQEEYRQDILIMSAINYIVDSGLECNYFLPLDSDEFPAFRNLDHASNCLSKIPFMHIGFYSWETYVPTALNFDDLKVNGLITCFKKRVYEGIRYEKIAIPFDLGKEIIVGPGAHTASLKNGGALYRYLLPIKLGHFPVRSAAQIILKNLTAVYGLLRKDNRLKYEGLHVFEILKKLDDSSFDLSLYDLQNTAYIYANNSNIKEFNLGDPPLWIDSYSLHYTSFSSLSALKILSSILVNSWITPISKDQISDVLNVFSQ